MKSPIAVWKREFNRRGGKTFKNNSEKENKIIVVKFSISIDMYLKESKILSKNLHTTKASKFGETC